MISIKILFLNLIGLYLSLQMCVEKQNFCSKCHSKTNLCIKCEYDDILIPDEEGGCTGINKCFVGKNYCNQCTEEANLCNECEQGFYPDKNGGCSFTKNCELSFFGHCIKCESNYYLIGNEIKMCIYINKSDEINNGNKLYKRDELIKLPESENKVLNIEQSKLLENKFGIDKIKGFLKVNLSYLYFYHYNCESVIDQNWGCAWRSMQTTLKYQLSLSNQNKDISFYELFMKYGEKNTLIDIFKKMKKDQDISEIINKLKNKIFAPYEINSGCAEPFISQLVLYDFGFDGELILINGYCNLNYAPEEVFLETIDFNKFKEKLKIHFSQINPGPIIIDDAYISAIIFGVKFNEKNKSLELLIMDPHGVEDDEKGIYIIVLDEDGKYLEIIPNEPVLQSSSIFFSNNKEWMAYFPKTN